MLFNPTKLHTKTYRNIQRVSFRSFLDENHLLLIIIYWFCWLKYWISSKNLTLNFKYVFYNIYAIFNIGITWTSILSLNYWWWKIKRIKCSQSAQNKCEVILDIRKIHLLQLSWLVMLSDLDIRTCHMWRYSASTLTDQSTHFNYTLYTLGWSDYELIVLVPLPTRLKDDNIWH